MCMTDRQIDNRCKKIADLQERVNTLQAEIDALKEELKTDMGTDEERRTNNFVLRYQTITQSRFDSTAFKKAMPEMYKQYNKVSQYRRFSIA